MIDVTSEQLNIQITDQALKQIQLIKTNDYTVADMIFRLKIDGKGCSGFDYALGFTPAHPEDLIHTITSDTGNLELHIDPFSAFYCKEGMIDFILDIQNNEEGFHFENLNEKSYRGKFFKDESKAPIMKELS